VYEKHTTIVSPAATPFLTSFIFGGWETAREQARDCKATQPKTGGMAIAWHCKQDARPAMYKIALPKSSIGKSVKKIGG